LRFLNWVPRTMAMMESHIRIISRVLPGPETLAIQRLHIYILRR
jgi:hypothetical protein